MDLTEGSTGLLRAKDGHSYMRSMVFPLKGSMFEQMHTYVPYEAQAVLTQEYGIEALERKIFRGFVNYFCTSFLFARKLHA